MRFWFKVVPWSFIMIWSTVLSGDFQTVTDLIFVREVLTYQASWIFQSNFSDSKIIGSRQQVLEPFYMDLP